MRRLRTRLEQVADFERETAAQTRESIDALEARIRTLEDLVRARDAAVRESEQARLALLEKTKRLQAEASTRADDLELNVQRAKRMEETVALLTNKVARSSACAWKTPSFAVSWMKINAPPSRSNDRWTCTEKPREPRRAGNSPPNSRRQRARRC